jgi:hypothetical protein
MRFGGFGKMGDLAPIPQSSRGREMMTLLAAINAGFSAWNFLYFSQSHHWYNLVVGVMAAVVAVCTLLLIAKD